MKLVSIITPCWNGEKYLHSYFQCLMEQTYKNFEVIIINDGSSDNSERIIKHYINIFKNNDIKIIYRKQKNKGQAEATNKALKLMNGDYFCLLDCDDTIEPTSIEKRVEFLDKNKQYGFVRTDGYLYDENNMNEPKYSFSSDLKNKYIEQIFEPLILEEGIYVANGCYMFRTDAFRNVNPKFRLVNSRGGQNWQILIPISYKYKCGYIDECLFNYREINSSHSHAITESIDKEIKRSNEHKELLLNILNELDVETIKFRKMIDKKYLIRNMEICIRHNEKKQFNFYYKEYYQKYNFTLKYFLYKVAGINIFTKFFHIQIRKIKSKLSR